MTCCCTWDLFVCAAGTCELSSCLQGEPAALLVAIDVSASALRGGHLEFVTQQILALLNSLKR